MGICLDTDANAVQDGEASNQWNADHSQVSSGDGQRRFGAANGKSDTDLTNTGKIKFDPPKVPVIFVLGGPGSGKVTHCDTFMQERRGVTHINMMDLLQQYAMGNATNDFSQLPSKTVTEVLMLEMKMAPAAKAYLISGYPRSMRDVVEYTEKIQVVSGVVLISWRESILKKQIEYGARLGHVVLSLAKMELENFFTNVMPVADYYDQSDMLIAVNGERSPTDVYKDFRAAVLDILTLIENQEAILNGVSGMGRGINDIPGSIVSVDTAPSQEKNLTEISGSVTNAVSTSEADDQQQEEDPSNAAKTMSNSIPQFPTSIGPVVHSPTIPPSVISAVRSVPPVIWVIGGPGSNKAMLCIKAISLNPGWAHFSMGRLLRSITETAPRANTENYAVKEALAAGEMVPEKNINIILESNMNHFADKTGIIIDGYPRNIEQVKYFENRYKQQPQMILLDCSKLQLGRGRIDDTVSSFRRRLELFREQTLPMLKSMDISNRLQIIDGDTDSPSVQREFEKSIRHYAMKLSGTKTFPNTQTITGSLMMASNPTDAILHDLEGSVNQTVVPTISHHISLMNGKLKKQTQPQVNTNQRGQPLKATAQMNGDISATYKGNFRRTSKETDRYPVDSYI